MSALPLAEAQQRAAELTEAFIEDIGRQTLGRLPASMTQEQRHAAIDSIASVIRDIDALLARVAVVQGNTRQASQATRVRNRLNGLRAVAFTVMAALNPEQAWFWTEEWQAKEREADADEAAGRMTFHATTEDFLNSLEARMHRADA